MKIDEKTYKEMPPELQSLFRKLPNPGSAEVVALFPESKTARCEKPSDCAEDGQWGTLQGRRGPRGYDGDGSAARFFYCAKPDEGERGRFNNHPTVKPVALMRYLLRLVTPPGGIVLDPFLGSGTTGVAADQDGFEWVGIERDEHSAEVAKRRTAEKQESLFGESEP